MKTAFRIASVLAIALLFSACASEEMLTGREKELLRRDDTIAADFGDAMERNMAVQIIDPTPAYRSDDPVHDGRVILGAYGRYRTGQVVQPQAIGSVSFGGGQ